MIHRTRSGGHGVLRLAEQAGHELPLAEAVERLNASLAPPYLFFADPRTRRGRVLYRRYDGHLGLIAPAW